jgi:hypothetical protein
MPGVLKIPRDQADSLERPFALLLFNTWRPPLVAMRALNP